MTRSDAYIGLDVRWPWPSPLGNRMTLADVCVKNSLLAGRTYDTQANHCVAHHNLAALCWGIALANRVFDAESLDHNHTIGRAEGAVVELIDRVFASGSMDELDSYEISFAKLRHGKIDVRWTPEPGQVAKRESSLGAAGRPKVRHDQYTKETRT